MLFKRYEEFRNIRKDNCYDLRLTGIVYFNHRHGCQNCSVLGEFRRRRMSYPRINESLRTDLSFRTREDHEHHRSYSCMERLPIDMIADFVIADPLHLLELGIMRKLLYIWIFGKVTPSLKLRKNDVQQLDVALLECNQSLPTEIHRKIRVTKWLKYWKGSEYRTVLLYIGIVVLKKKLPVELYEHFLFLFCAVTMCSVDAYKDFVPLAKTLFDEFIRMYIDLYGLHAVSSIVHNLCHVTENVERFGNLNSISTYPFENAARHIKLKLKQCDKSIEQASRRIYEMNLLQRREKSHISANNVCLKFPFFPFGNKNDFAYQYVSFKGIIFSNRKQGDKWFSTITDEIVEFKCAIKLNGQLIICGSPLKRVKDFFTRPFRSRYLDICECDRDFHSDKAYQLNEIKSKMFCLCTDNRFVFMPLLHSIDVLNENPQ